MTTTTTRTSTATRDEAATRRDLAHVARGLARLHPDYVRLGESLRGLRQELQRMDAAAPAGDRAALEALEHVELLGHGLDTVALHALRLAAALDALAGREGGA